MTDLVNKEFGLWRVLAMNGGTMCFCKCRCGVEKDILIGNLKSGKSKSCGFNKSKAIKEAKTTHGVSKELLYKVWRGMKSRCTNEKDRKYHLYGGRGISVCREWEDVLAFMSWANYNGYKRGLQIDRIDNDGDYEPSNCRFVTNKVNSMNTRISKNWFLFGNKFESSTDASKYFEVNIATIKAWCDGYVAKGKFYPPKDNCYSELKYNKLMEIENGGN